MLNPIIDPTESLNSINGSWCEAECGDLIEVRCPSDASVIASIPRSKNTDIYKACHAARSAYDNGDWSRCSPVDRGRLLYRLGELILQNHDALSNIEACDTGKPLLQARNDITATARYFEFYSGGVDKIGGETIPYLNEYSVMTLRESHGVTGHIIPWNYPAQMFGRTLAPALAMGNAVILKPAEDACLTPIALVSLAKEAGFPEGSINLVCGYGYEAGQALAQSPEIDFLSFTGSPETGVHVQAAAARNLVDCTLELGGKSPQIVFADADLEMALPILVNAIIQNSGQTCSAGSRILIESIIYEELVDMLIDRFSKLIVGPHDSMADLGALISAKQQNMVQNYLNMCGSQGYLSQGSILPTAPETGYYVRPTLFGPVNPGARIAQEEVFGPVLVCMPFKDEQEALTLANGTAYGLVAGIWTRDGSRQTRMAKSLNCGQVFVNCFGAGGGVELPFGGVGKSGHGREKGVEALREFSRIKTVVQFHG